MISPLLVFEMRQVTSGLSHIVDDICGRIEPTSSSTDQIAAIQALVAIGELRIACTGEIGKAVRMDWDGHANEIRDIANHLEFDDKARSLLDDLKHYAKSLEAYGISDVQELVREMQECTVELGFWCGQLWDP